MSIFMLLSLYILAPTISLKQCPFSCYYILLNIGGCPPLLLPFPSLPSLVTNFASPMGIEIKTKWLSQVACCHHKLRNFCLRLTTFWGFTEKMKTATFFVFPCSSLWCTLFFLSMHFSWRKLWNKIAFFRLF